MLAADVVVRAVHPTLEVGPKALNAIRPRNTPHILSFAVVHDMVLVSFLTNSTIGAVVVGKYNRLLRDVLFNDGVEREPICFLYHLSHNSPVPLFQSDDRGLVGYAAPLAYLLVGVLVLFPAADIGFVHLNIPFQLSRRYARSPYALGHEPSRFLLYAQLLSQFNGRNAVAGSGHEIHGQKPYPHIYMTAFHYRPRLASELPLAVAALVRLYSRDFVYRSAFALRANYLATPSLLDKVGDCRLFIRKPLCKKFDDPYVFLFFHAFSIRPSLVLSST